MRSLVWFRGKDLRLADHAPLAAALRGELVCAFVLDPYFFAPERARAIAHRMQLLLEGVAALAAAIEQRGSRLVLVEGRSVDVVPEIARAWRVDRVVAQRWTEPFGRVRDERIAGALDVPFDLFEGETLAPHGSLRNASGKPFSVFGAFARAFRASVDVGRPIPAPRSIPAPPRDVRAPRVSLPTLASLGITRNDRLLPGGEPAARQRLRRFLRRAAARYDVDRDRLDHDGTSRLSVDLKFGTLSPRTVWTAAARALARAHPAAWRSFSNELAWREFAHAVLWDHPDALVRPHRPLPVRPRADERGWRAWRDGLTGYPVVDAAARQLLAEGFVPNRARMIAASFLTKDLGVDFRRGEAHYLAELADGDWAQNDFNWQWVAGCGFDAAPYFRVFNPVAQGKKFDPTGAWVRRWVPELAALPDRWLHEPWNAPPDVLRAAGVVLGRTYPRPIVDHAEARARYLARAHRSR